MYVCMINFMWAICGLKQIHAYPVTVMYWVTWGNHNLLCSGWLYVLTNTSEVSVWSMNHRALASNLIAALLLNGSLTDIGHLCSTCVQLMSCFCLPICMYVCMCNLSILKTINTSTVGLFCPSVWATSKMGSTTTLCVCDSASWTKSKYDEITSECCCRLQDLRCTLASYQQCKQLQ